MKNRLIIWATIFIVVLGFSVIGVGCSSSKEDVVTQEEISKSVSVEENEIVQETAVADSKKEPVKQVKKVEPGQKLVIKCVGDSVTEGLSMPDAHQAIIGGDTYPSILYTMLQENGIDAVVENAGHGGENTAAVVARMGGADMHFNEDISFNADGLSDSIDEKITAVYDANLEKPVEFTYTETDVNPVVVDGVEYEAVRKKLDGQETHTYLKKTAEGGADTIKAGTDVELTGTRDNSVTIIFAGINDSKDTTIDEYVTMLKSGIEACGDDYIILGPHSRLYDKEGFVTGANAQEKRENYRNRMIAEFGDRFVDLNTEWCARVLPMALENGYFSDLSQGQIDAIQAKLDKRTIPGEFSINHNDHGVHLTKPGYMTIAQIVYERLQLLGYID